MVLDGSAWTAFAHTAAASEVVARNKVKQSGKVYNLRQSSSWHETSSSL